ncbi:unnamed protein product [Schistosoma haematobium]|nr:unnamed protein product [Schistosoma haematobium]
MKSIHSNEINPLNYDQIKNSIINPSQLPIHLHHSFINKQYLNHNNNNNSNDNILHNQLPNNNNNNNSISTTDQTLNRWLHNNPLTTTTNQFNDNVDNCCISVLSCPRSI